MNIRSVAGPNISPLVDVTLQQQNKMPSSVPPAPVPERGSRQFWRPGLLVHKLEQLQQQSPEKFREIVGQLANSLQQIADQAGSANGPVARLAQIFKQVADTGDIASLGQLLHHPDLATHLRDAAGNEPLGVEANTPTTHAHSFGAILSMYTGEGIAKVLAAATRQINEALRVGTTNSPSNSSSSTNTSTAVDVPSPIANSSAAAVSSAASPVVTVSTTPQVSITAIENAAIMAIKSGA
jgi:hypothetical protein